LNKRHADERQRIEKIREEMRAGSRARIKLPGE
jgi:hypothetical protein